MGGKDREVLDGIDSAESVDVQENGVEQTGIQERVEGEGLCLNDDTEALEVLEVCERLSLGDMSGLNVSSIEFLIEKEFIEVMSTEEYQNILSEILKLKPMDRRLEDLERETQNLDAENERLRKLNVERERPRFLLASLLHRIFSKRSIIRAEQGEYNDNCFRLKEIQKEREPIWEKIRRLRELEEQLHGYYLSCDRFIRVSFFGEQRIRGLQARGSELRDISFGEMFEDFKKRELILF